MLSPDAQNAPQKGLSGIPWSKLRRLERASLPQLHNGVVVIRDSYRPIAGAALGLRQKLGRQTRQGGECLTKDRDALLAFYDFPAEHRKHPATIANWPRFSAGTMPE